MRCRTRTCSLLLLAGGLAGALPARAEEPAVTILADYEDNNVAVRITAAENVLASDCAARLTPIPARGQRSLMVGIGATRRNASVACDLRFRLATRFSQADRVATHAWIDQGEVEIAFRILDARERVFETTPRALQARNRWVRIVADLAPRELRLAQSETDEAGEGTTKPVWPIEIRGYRISTRDIGRQTVFLDDLEVEHRVEGPALLRGEFRLDRPTHLYEPGAAVQAAVVLENLSRQRALPLSVDLAWSRADGSVLANARQSINLPASGSDFRSRQSVDFSRQISEPGLYRLTAWARAPRWTAPAVVETTIAVTPSNRALPRGRSTFFGVQTNLMREPPADQLLEIDIAREIGVQLLGLETPWRVIEPRRGGFDFTQTDALIERISQLDIATMIILTEPPDWAPQEAAALWEAQSALFQALAEHYGKRVAAYQPMPVSPDGARKLSEPDLAAMDEIRQRVKQLHLDADVVTYALPVSNTNDDDLLPANVADADVQLALRTTGDPAAAADRLDDLAARFKLNWSSRQRWFHEAQALPESGTLYDAVAVLRYYVRAAKAGVAGAVWFDLRDDSNDREPPELARGLVQRDFSPKTPLLGLANTIGELAGLIYAGTLPGAPAEFDSALFVGGQRQVAVLFPRPNRLLPAVLVPYQVVPGMLTVANFDRRALDLLRSPTTPLLPVERRPFFIIFNAERAQADPKIGLAHPWLRVPATICCAKETTFRIELDAAIDLRRSYLRLMLPADCPVQSSLSSRALRATAGETLAFDVTLTRDDGVPFEPTTLEFRLRLEGISLDVPLTLRPLFDVSHISSPARITADEFAIGQLTSQAPQESPARSLPIHVACDDADLHVAIRVPPDPALESALCVGVAVANADTHTEVLIEHVQTRPKLSPAHGTSPTQLRGWRCRLIEDRESAAHFCHIMIPFSSLGLSQLEPDTRLLLAARLLDSRPADRAIDHDLRWGGGLDGTRSSSNYQWIRLPGPP